MRSIAGELKKQSLEDVCMELQGSGLIDPNILPEYAGGGNVGLLVGIQDVRINPVILVTLPSGVGVYQCLFVNSWGSSLVFAGPHPSFQSTRVETASAAMIIHLLSAPQSAREARKTASEVSRSQCSLTGWVEHHKGSTVQLNVRPGEVFYGKHKDRFVQLPVRSMLGNGLSWAFMLTASRSQWGKLAMEARRKFTDPRYVMTGCVLNKQVSRTYATWGKPWRTISWALRVYAITDIKHDWITYCFWEKPAILFLVVIKWTSEFSKHQVQLFFPLFSLPAFYNWCSAGYCTFRQTLINSYFPATVLFGKVFLGWRFALRKIQSFFPFILHFYVLCSNDYLLEV